MPVNDECLDVMTVNSSLQGAYLIVATRSNFLCNLGYGDPSKLFPRSPRLKLACTLL